jgi:hypothetical protein
MFDLLINFKKINYENIWIKLKEIQKHFFQNVTDAFIF